MLQPAESTENALHSKLKALKAFGFSPNQIGTALQRACLHDQHASPRTTALRFHAIELLTRDDADFAAFRSGIQLQRMIKQYADQAGLSENDLNGAEVSQLIFLTDSILAGMTPETAQQGEKMAGIQSEARTGAMGMLDATA